MNPIIIFDSGFGGLTVFDAVRKKLPGWPLVYCFDNDGFPYGIKSESFLVERVGICVEQLYQFLTPSMIVMACNTASTIVLPKLRAQLDIPVVGVVPAIKPAARLSEKQCIGLLATPGTISRRYTSMLLKMHATGCAVIQVGSVELVAMAEQKLQGKPVCTEQIRDILKPFLEHHIIPDYVVMGCTHFPFLKSEFQYTTRTAEIRWIDSATAIADRVACLLDTEVVMADRDPEHRAFCTKAITETGSHSRIFSSRQIAFPELLFNTKV